MALHPLTHPEFHRHIHRTYLPGGIYFVTTDVRSHTPFFEDEHLARIVEQSIWHERTARFIVYAYVVMPDHLHVLLQPTKRNISEIMRSVKTNTSRDINRYMHTSSHHNASPGTRVMEHGMPDIKMRFSWQEKFYDHVIRDERDFRTHVEYIRHNPVKAGLVRTPEEYPLLHVDWEAIREVLGGS